MTNRKPTQAVQIAEMAKDVGYIKAKVDSIEKDIKADYVSRTEFEPIKKLVYGMVTLILSGVVVAVISLVLRQPV